MRLRLLVIYTPLLDETRRFYESLGLTFKPEQHGNGPEHYAAVMTDGTVFELYPATSDRRTDSLRLACTVDAASTSLNPGHGVLHDPDGRAVEVHVR
ncbi:glyoxalase/bleomycin resistance/dioxygenase family protein [Actinomadura sp. NPDC047616]|uniref:glyoxalase/bleomycin resistance/dioxygenase family protein n=1 Tax=Actinomadura sp. NPDC047616 TaxID=3155914 RepID=UPI00340A0ADD